MRTHWFFPGIRRYLGILFLLAFSIAPAGAQESSYSLQITNTLDIDISYLFISAGESEYWGIDLLGGTAEQKNLVPAESSIRISGYGPESLELDILAITSGGQMFAQWAVPVYPDQTGVISIRTDQEFEQPVDIDAALMPLRVENRLRLPVEDFFTAPGDVDGYAFNALHSESGAWSAGENLVFWYFYGWEEPLFYRAESEAGIRSGTVILEEDESLLILE